jgi:cell division protein FtsB
MYDFHEKKRARRRLYSPLTFIILGALIFIVLYNVWDMYQKSRRTAEALQKTRDAYDVLAAREGFLEERLEQLSTEAGVESEIRERFGVAKAGEEVIVVLSEEESRPSVPKEKGLWERLKEWLTGTRDDYVRE